MKKIIVTTHLATALIFGSGIFAYEHAQVEQLQKNNEKLVQKIDQTNNKVSNLETKNENYVKLTKKFEDSISQLSSENKKLKATNTKLKKTERIKTSRSLEQSVKTVYVTATAYTSQCAGCSGITTTGVNIRNTVYYNGARIIAVDPNVIPLNSVVRVFPHDRPSFIAVAKDTGGAIKGNNIDFLISTSSTQEALSFGRQENVKVKILKVG